MQIFPTRMCNVTSVTSNRTARSLAKDPRGWGEFPGIWSVSYLSFVYCCTGGVCGRSFTAGEILFTGRQTCMLPLFSIMTLWSYRIRLGVAYHFGFKIPFLKWIWAIINSNIFIPGIAECSMDTEKTAIRCAIRIFLKVYTGVSCLNDNDNIYSKKETGDTEK